MSKEYQGLPIPQTPEQKAAFDKTYRAVFGVKVKIPPPGGEKDALVHRIRTRVMGASGGQWLACDTIEWVLDALAGEEE